MNNNQNHAGCLNGVKCCVANCVHNTSGDCCNAPKIDVENRQAENKVETYCNTFAPKDGCCH